MCNGSDLMAFESDHRVGHPDDAQADGHRRRRTVQRAAGGYRVGRHHFALRTADADGASRSVRCVPIPTPRSPGQAPCNRNSARKCPSRHFSVAAAANRSRWNSTGTDFVVIQPYEEATFQVGTG